MTDTDPPFTPDLKRRGLLQAAATGTLVALLPMPLRAAATDSGLADTLRDRFGNTTIQEGRVTLTLPALAENGNSVEMTVTVESAMTDADHVERIAVFAPANPVPQLTEFHLAPRCGLARATTRIRLADSQTVTAVAQMNDGTLWSGTARTVVTLAACLDLT
jgi:sulfur-oxidizing protein SoxY